MIIKSIFICSVRRSLACFVGKADLRQLALLQREKQARLEALERGEKSVERKPITHFREWQVGECPSRQSWRLGGAWHGKVGNNMFGERNHFSAEFEYAAQDLPGYALVGTPYDDSCLVRCLLPSRDRS